MPRSIFRSVVRGSGAAGAARGRGAAAGGLHGRAGGLAAQRDGLREGGVLLLQVLIVIILLAMHLDFTVRSGRGCSAPHTLVSEHLNR